MNRIGMVAVFVATASTIVPAQSTFLGRPANPQATDAVLVMRYFTVATGEGYGTVPHLYTVEAKRALGSLANVGVVGKAGGTDSVATPRSAVLAASEVTYNALSLLGIRPVLGRDFSEADARAGRRLAILGHASWIREFKSQPDIVGLKMRRFNGTTLGDEVEIVGVLPPGAFSTTPELDVEADVLVLSRDCLDDATLRKGWYAPILRLAPGVTAAQVQTALNAVVAKVQGSGAGERGTGLRLESLRQK